MNKNKTPSTEQEPFKGCSPIACGCKSLADCPSNQPQITVMGQGFRFKKFSLIQEEPRSVATDKTEVTEQESQEELTVADLKAFIDHELGGYKIIHIGYAHNVINRQFIYESDISSLALELLQNFNITRRKP